MKPFIFEMPVKIIFERGGISRVGDEAASLGKRCLLVSGRTFARTSGYLDSVNRKLQESSLEVVIFDKVEPNPSVQTVYDGANLGRANRCDVVVAFGGGSAIDAAKAIAFLMSNETKLEDHFYPNIIVEPTAPVMTIPTTCGTGSEVTKYAVISDTTVRKKKVLMGPSILPKIALLDPAVLDHLPSHMVAYTSFDALSHSFESILSKASCDISNMFAAESIRIILQFLVDAYLGHLEARERIFLGSMLAGIAINFTGTNIIHAMGYYLTNYHGIHHGLANAILLPHALRFQLNYLKDEFQRLAVSSGFKDAEALVRFIEHVADKIGIPNSLLELDIRIDEIEPMVQDAMSYRRNIENSPIEISFNDIKKLYLEAFRGRRAM